MTRDEAELYLELLGIAYSEGIGSDAVYDLGRRVRDEHFPGEYVEIFERAPFTWPVKPHIESVQLVSSKEHAWLRKLMGD
jgi:hypothetical protein